MKKTIIAIIIALCLLVPLCSVAAKTTNVKANVNASISTNKVIKVIKKQAKKPVKKVIKKTVEKIVKSIVKKPISKPLPPKLATSTPITIPTSTSVIIPTSTPTSTVVIKHRTQVLDQDGNVLCDTDVKLTDYQKTHITFPVVKPNENLKITVNDNSTNTPLIYVFSTKKIYDAQDGPNNVYLDNAGNYVSYGWAGMFGVNIKIYDNSGSKIFECNASLSICQDIHPPKSMSDPNYKTYCF